MNGRSPRKDSLLASASIPYDGETGGDGIRGRVRAVRTSGRGLFWPFLLAYLVAALALWRLVLAGGIWNVLGISRLLYPLSQGGVIAITDADQGFFHGLPDPKYYAYAHDPVGW